MEGRYHIVIVTCQEEPAIRQVKCPWREPTRSPLRDRLSAESESSCLFHRHKQFGSWHFVTAGLHCGKKCGRNGGHYWSRAGTPKACLWRGDDLPVPDGVIVEI